MKIDPTCLSFDFNLLFFLLLRSMSLVSKIYRVLTLFIFFFQFDFDFVEEKYEIF